MLHPSYSDLMKVVNQDVEEGETPVVNSRYSIVMATAKRARQIIARQTRGGEEMKHFAVSKPLSKAVNELYTGQLRILPGEEEGAIENKTTA
ncbi:MAG: DNA-directed RNA polymerase subunit omega [Lachnospiraceae bacterium]|nr:DNA-directed RNA polymerase subunit omega [Lachnospiraceae bacterium]